ncbi:hypothetical protein XENOCAPTIV_020126 [Xenoophorus captivus]|uniref:Ig-like domain-containing protein n=1 Tax=Xenoophorus captivus TaxID=1517983 RepID=A0ABV0RRP3_9TELE
MMKLVVSEVHALMSLLLYVNSGICQDSVISGFVGEDILLPCVYKNPVPVHVFWRINDADAVLDIINSNPSTATQIAKYSGRVFSFPKEYSNGNFSIVIKKLQLDDANLYECKIPDADRPKSVKLQVSDQDKERKTMPPPADGAAASNLSVVLLCAVSLLICF